MATVKGTWVFNETIEMGTFITQSVKFASGNLVGFIEMKLLPDGLYYGISGLDDLETVMEEYWIYDSIGNIWEDGEGFRTVDFGSTEQTVSDEFYTWFITNAVQQVDNSSTEITYNGTAIASIEAGQTAKLVCAGKKAVSDIVIVFASDGSISYNGVTTEVEAGQTATLHCAEKMMSTDVVVTVHAVSPELEALAAPTISLDGNTLSITDESGLATEFAILVDGVEKTTVEVN